MEKIYKLIKVLMDELENSKTSKTGELQAGELEALKTLAVTAEKLYKICQFEEGDGGYSGDGMWEATGTYGRGSSYTRGGSRGGDGNYSGRRGQRRNSRGQYSRNGYSMDGKTDEMIEHVNEMMEIAPDERTRDMILRFKKQIEQA